MRPSISLVLLFSALLPAENPEWSTFRCIIQTTMVCAGLESKLTSVMACKRSSSGILSRITVIEPEERRCVTILKEGKRFAKFPGRPAMVVPETMEAPCSTAAPGNRAVVKNTDITVHGAMVRMPLSIEYSAPENGVEMITRYSGYRINEFIPDSTFSLPDEP